METIIKRNGSKEKFDALKITNAVHKCLTSGLGLVEPVSGQIADDITGRVINILSTNGAFVSVERVQDLVQEQLMAAGHFKAAERYIIYREEKRRKRVVLPIDPVDADFIARSNEFLPSAIQQFQHYSKYSRWMPDKQRRETWEESIDRTIAFFRKSLGNILEESEWNELKYSMISQQAFPAMRIFQMAGPAAERCNVACYNCAYLPIDSLFSFSELLYILMQGTGVGFSVEAEYVDKLPRIKKKKSNSETFEFIIEDSTEGWAEALRVGLETWYNGDDVIFKYHLLRPQGARLKTKGGRSSGPEPLKTLLDFTRSKISQYWSTGGRLSELDCLDICNYCGWIVQVGGVRRAAEIALFDISNSDVRNAKKGAFWESNPQRMMSNNSAVYEEKPDAPEFLRIMLDLIDGKSGEPGIFNRAGKIPKGRKRAKFGVNPCGEIILRARQFCNLSIAIARAGDTVEDLERKVRAATIFGTLQSMLTDFKYISPEWKKNCEEERLLGVDITGQMDCELLRWGAEGREELLEHLQQLVVSTNEDFARRFGINASASATCNKPGGNSAWLFQCNSSLTPRWARFQLRRVEAAVYDPVTKLLMDEGIPWHPKTGQDRENFSIVVFEFPVEAPEGAITRNDMTALEQLENWLIWKKHWTSHNPSYTCYVWENEWPEVIAWVYRNWENIGGLSFLPKDGGIYPLAPNEEITEEEYNRRLSVFPKIDWAKLIRYEQDDSTSSSQEFACIGDRCTI